MGSLRLRPECVEEGCEGEGVRCEAEELRPGGGGGKGGGKRGTSLRCDTCGATWQSAWWAAYLAKCDREASAAAPAAPAAEQAPSAEQAPAEAEGEAEAPAAPSAAPPAEVVEDAAPTESFGIQEHLLPADLELPGWTIVENKNGSTGRKWKVYHGPAGEIAKSRVTALAMARCVERQHEASAAPTQPAEPAVEKVSSVEAPA